MARIIPFQAIRYNTGKIKNLSRVITPPYDVISKCRQDKLYKANPYNFIRILLGRAYAKDNKNNNRYTRAAVFLKDWQSQEVLIQEKKPCVYIYEQAFKSGAEYRRRTGFISLLGIEPHHKAIILPHEKTFAKPKQDRLALIKSTKANLCPIFALYPDQRREIDRLISNAIKTPAFLSLKYEGITNRLWRISDKEFISKLKRLMRDKKIFIADGHHRYEAAYAFFKNTSKRKGLASADIMAYFSNIYSKGLKILPTHRVIMNIPRARADNLFNKLAVCFEITNLKSLKGLLSGLKTAKPSQHFFGMYTPEKRFYLLKLKSGQIITKGGFSRGYNELDAVILHRLILEKILRVNNKKCDNIYYTRDEKEALRLVDSGKYKAAFFMNAPRPSQIISIAGSFEKMPQKSTYFYPKPLSGLLINSLKNRI